MSGTIKYPTNKSDFKELSHAISHDLRAPIRTIEGFSQILAEDYSSKLDETGMEIIDTINESTAKLRASLEGLLDYSKLDSVIPDKTLFDPKIIIELIIEKLNIKSEQTIKWEIDDSFPSIFADQQLFSIALESLISNAIKFVKPNNLTLIKITGSQEDDFHKISVSDNGTGFDMRHLNKICRLFGRLVTDSQFSGVGLGLALTQKIMRLHQGKIGVSSRPSEGSIFILEFPVEAD